MSCRVNLFVLQIILVSEYPFASTLLGPAVPAGQLMDGSVTYDVTYDRGTVLSQARPARAPRVC